VSGYVAFSLSSCQSISLPLLVYIPLAFTIPFNLFLSIIRPRGETVLINRYPIRLERSIRIIHPPPPSPRHPSPSQASIELEAIDIDSTPSHASLVLSHHAANGPFNRTLSRSVGPPKQMQSLIKSRKQSIQASHRFISIKEIRD